MFQEIWKWDDARQRLEFARRYANPQWGQINPQAGPDSSDGGMARVVDDLREENARLRGALSGRDVQGKIADDLRQELQIVRRLYESKSIECARLQKRVEELEKAK